MRHLPPILSYTVNVTYIVTSHDRYFIGRDVGICDCHGYTWRLTDLLADDMGRSIICPITRWMNERPNEFYPAV